MDHFEITIYGRTLPSGMPSLPEIVGLFIASTLIGGYLTIKGLVWGSTLGILTWSLAPLMSTPREVVVTTLVQALSKIALAFPSAIIKAGHRAHAEYGFLGVVGVALLAIIGGVLYLVGVYLGVRFWPEIKISKKMFSFTMNRMF